MRYRTHGDPLYTKIASPLDTAEERLQYFGWVVKDSGCWEWSGPKHKQGYGRIRWLGKLKLAHVLAYETWVGIITSGLKVRHTCDNPPYINPEHLIVGTQADNVNDMVLRGRNRKK
jgi:hypothetical protein